MDWERALAAPETYVDYQGEDEDEDAETVVFLSPTLLRQIAVKDVPIGAVIGVGSLHHGSLEIFWEGRLICNSDRSFNAVIHHDIVHKYWEEAIGSHFYLDLLHKCVLSMTGMVSDLEVEDLDDSDDVASHFEYKFRTDGENLEDIFNEACRVQDHIESPAQYVIDDVTRALARSADRVLRGHYAQASDLVARVEAAKSPSRQVAKRKRYYS